MALHFIMVMTGESVFSILLCVQYPRHTDEDPETNKQTNKTRKILRRRTEL